MRFVPPVAGLSAGRGLVRRRPAHAPARSARCWPPCARSASASTTTAADRCRSRSAARGSVRGGTVVIDASASSQFVSALLLAGARYEQGVDVRHDGKPVPVAPPHRHDGRDAPPSTASRSTTPRPTAGRSPRARSRAVDHLIEPDLSNAAPFLALAAVTGGSVTVRDWPRVDHPGRRRAARDPPLMGCDVDLVDDGLPGPRHRAPARHRRRPARRRRADARGGGALRAGRLAVAPARHRPHPRPRDRPAGGAGHRARRARAPTSPSTPTGSACAPRACTAGSSTPTPTTGWRTPA